MSSFQWFCRTTVPDAAATLAASTRRIGIGAAVLICQVLFATAAHSQTCISITANGGVGNGTTDNTSAFNLTVSQLPAQGGCIAFPAGKYLFNSTLTVNFPTGIYSLRILGAGADSTTLYFPNSNGIVINAQNTGSQGLQSVHVSDVTMTTGQAGTYSALTLNKPGVLVPFGQSDITRTTFRGDDGAALTDYWAVAVAVMGVSNVNFDSDLFYGNAAGSGGTGISLTGCSAGDSDGGYTYCMPQSGSTVAGKALVSNRTVDSNKQTPAAAVANSLTTIAAGQLMANGGRFSAPRVKEATPTCTCGTPTPSPFGIAFNIARSGFYSLGSGLTVGNLIQGVIVAQSIFANGITGIFVPQSAHGLTEITITGSTFNCTGSQIVAESAVASIIMNGNLLKVAPNTAGLWFDAPGGDQNSLVNNIFTGTSTSGASGTGVLVNFSGSGVIAWSQASGNVFNNLSVGVDLSSALQWNVQANAYDSGVATQVYNPLGTANSVGVATN